MRYASIKKNDIANGPGVCVSFFAQGCPHRCSGCFNPETWDFNGGKEFTSETMNTILDALTANGIHRDLNILGGEPLCKPNDSLTAYVIKTVKEKLPQTKIYIWTGYLYEELLAQAETNVNIDYILKTANYLIDGPFVLTQKDLTLQMRGSRNQRIVNLTNKKFYDKI